MGSCSTACHPAGTTCRGSPCSSPSFSPSWQQALPMARLYPRLRLSYNLLTCRRRLRFPSIGRPGTLQKGIVMEIIKINKIKKIRNQNLKKGVEKKGKRSLEEEAKEMVAI